MDKNPTLAPLGSRSIASILDIVVIALFSVAIAVISSIDVMIFQMSGFDVDKGLYMFSWGVISYFIFTILYETIIPANTDGQTLGTKLLKLRIVKNDGSSTELKYKLHLIRAVFFLIEVAILFPIGITMILISGKRIGDHVAGTKVVLIPEEVPKDVV